MTRPRAQRIRPQARTELLVRDLSPHEFASLGTMLYNRTGSWRYLKPYYQDNLTPACQNACPAGNDIEGWIRLLAVGADFRAFRHLKREQPFPLFWAGCVSNSAKRPATVVRTGPKREHRRFGTLPGRPGPGQGRGPGPAARQRRGPGRGRVRAGGHVGRVLRPQTGV